MTQSANLAALGSNVNSSGIAQAAGGGTGGTAGPTFRNRIINGAMVIDQRNAGASVTNNTAWQYTVDRFAAYGSVSSKFTVQQNAGAGTTPPGFTKYLGITSSSAYTVNSGDQFLLRQVIEGYNIADLDFGKSTAKTVTLSFWTYSSLTGTFSAALKSTSGSARSFPFSYTISAANTWTQVSVTIPGDTSGTWATDNTAGMQIWFNIGGGSSFLTTGGSWVAGDFQGVTGSVSVVGTSGATFYITGVQLEVGSSATGFEYRMYGQELALCQRYYQQLGSQGAGDRIPCFAGNTTNAFSANLLITSMRSQPTLTVTGAMDFDQYYLSGFSQSSANVARNSGGTNSVVANFGNYSGLNAGRAGGIYGNTTGVLQISAEL